MLSTWVVPEAHLQRAAQNHNKWTLEFLFQFVIILMVCLHSTLKLWDYSKGKVRGKLFIHILIGLIHSCCNMNEGELLLYQKVACA